MATGPTSTPAAGGCLLALAIVVGAAIGFFVGQPSIGLLAGGGAGALLAVLVWVLDRNRR
jgi:uncharacterized membrane protein (UPF0136 family)